MIGFYIFGAMDIQQVYPIFFFEALKRDECWIAFFDCYIEKKQFYNYSSDELIKLILSVWHKFGYKNMPVIKYYGAGDKNNYLNNTNTIRLEKQTITKDILNETCYNYSN